MNTIDDLRAKARSVKLVSSAGFDADGVKVDGWADAAEARFVFEDGETLTIPRELLRDPDIGEIKFRI